MKSTLYPISVLLVTLFILVGCSKKEPPAAPAAKTNQQPQNIVDGIPDTSDSVAETTESLSMDIDLEKTVYDLKKEAEQMDVETLRTVALKYKEAVEEKRAEWDVLTEQLAAVSPDEKTEQKAEELKANMDALAETSQQLTQRFNVYLDAVKAKNGNTEGLTL